MVVDRSVALTGKDWLQSGYEIWTAVGCNPSHDYLVPQAVKDMQSTIKKMAKPLELAAHGKSILLELR